MLWFRIAGALTLSRRLTLAPALSSSREGKHEQSAALGEGGTGGGDREGRVSVQVKGSDWSVTSSKSSASSALIGSAATDECCDWLEQDGREARL